MKAEVDKAGHSGIHYHQYGSGYSPLQTAAKEGNVKALHCILEAKADVNANKNKSSTALEEAVSWNHPECVRSLLRAKAYTFTKNSGKKRTPLETVRARIALCEPSTDRFVRSSQDSLLLIQSLLERELANQSLDTEADPKPATDLAGSPAAKNKAHSSCAIL